MDNKNTAERKRLGNTNSAKQRHKFIGDPHKELVVMDVLNQKRVLSLKWMWSETTGYG